MGLMARLLHVVVWAGRGVRARSLHSAVTMVGSQALVDAKQRFLDRSMADGRRGARSQGVRWWLVYTVWGLGVGPLPDPLDRSVQAAAIWETRLEDYAVWVAYSRPSGRQVSHASVLKYVSETRGWVLKSTVPPPIRLGLGYEVSRIPAILRGYARDVPQPPKMERIGVAPQDLGRAMRLDGTPLNWRSALTFGVAVLARGIEFALGDDEDFEPSEHMLPADVSLSTFDGSRIARVRMRKRKDLRVLRGKHAEVVLVGQQGAFIDAVADLEAWLAERVRLGIPEGRPLFCHTERPWRAASRFARCATR